MTEQPVEPRERGEDQNPETVSPLPESSGSSDDTTETGDRYAEALSGAGGGTETRAGSPQGGSASGAETGDGQSSIDRNLTTEGMTDAEPKSFEAETASSDALDSQEAVNNVGQPNLGPHGDPVEGKRDAAATGGDDADAATG